MNNSRALLGGICYQQRLSSWDPSFNSRSAALLLFCVGLGFLGLAVIILYGSAHLKSITISYADCLGANRVTNCYSTTCVCRLNFTLSEDMPGPVFLYYQLTNFYQNHRTYIRSVSYEQLTGHPISKKELERCHPLDFSKESQYTFAYLPCGHMANSIFNDTFEIFYLPDSLTIRKLVPFEVHNLVSYSIKSRKYGRLSEKDVVNTSKPEFWRKTALERDPDAFVGDESLMVWMQPAPLPTFQKLAGVLDTSSDPFKNGLPKGFYTIDVDYNFPTSNGGDKRIIVANTNALGGKNPTLGYLFVVAGLLEIVIGMVFVVVSRRQRIVKNHLKDWSSSWII